MTLVTLLALAIGSLLAAPSVGRQSPETPRRGGSPPSAIAPTRRASTRTRADLRHHPAGRSALQHALADRSLQLPERRRRRGQRVKISPDALT